MIRFVNDVEHDLVAFAGQLVRIPSVTGNEEGVAKALLAKLQSIGVDESWIDEAGNVIGVLYGNKHGPNILLSGHLDVVPPGRQDSWDFDPFVGDIDQMGRLRGRGSTDMKGGLAALVFTMKLLKVLRSRGIQLPGNVIFGAVVHEEAAEMLGMEFLCRSTLPRKGLGFDLSSISSTKSLASLNSLCVMRCYSNPSEAMSYQHSMRRPKTQAGGMPSPVKRPLCN